MPNATHHDAELVLKIFELRREEVMRKARNFMVLEFWPQSVDEVLAVMNARGTPNNAYFRQVITFYEMAATLPLHGAVHSDLFIEWNGELLFLFAKFEPLLAEIREKSGNPGFLGNCERYIQSSPLAQKKLAPTAARVAAMSASMRPKGKSKPAKKKK